MNTSRSDQLDDLQAIYTYGVSMKRQLIAFLAMASACLAAPGWANPSHMVTGVEIRDGKTYEVDLKPGGSGRNKSTGR
jgi:hypothetical protein